MNVVIRNEYLLSDGIRKALTRSLDELGWEAKSVDMVTVFRYPNGDICIRGRSGTFIEDGDG